MKKFLIILSVIVSLCLAVNANDDRFIEALKNCSHYTDSGSVNVSGVNAVTTKSISGWQNEKCIYKENLKMNGTNMNVSCHFSKPQIKEITSVADAYFLTQKYSATETDLSSLDAVKNNPLVNVFNKYLQDPSVCQITGME